jgi:hypothetical protein
MSSTAPTTTDIVNAVELAMSQIEYMRDLFAALMALAPQTGKLPIGGLADQGKYWADVAHNDLDCFREGIVGTKTGEGAA